jgi:hypothetical protein
VDSARGSRAGAGYPPPFRDADDDRRLRKAVPGSAFGDAAVPAVFGDAVVPGALRDPRAVAFPPAGGVPRTPTERIGAVERGTANPCWSGAALRTTNESRVRASMRVVLTTFALTYPCPNPLCGTTVHAFHGLNRYPPYTPTLENPNTARLFHPRGHQLT